MKDVSETKDSAGHLLQHKRERLAAKNFQERSYRAALRKITNE